MIYARLSSLVGSRSLVIVNLQHTWSIFPQCDIDSPLKLFDAGFFLISFLHTSSVYRSPSILLIFFSVALLGLLVEQTWPYSCDQRLTLVYLLIERIQDRESKSCFSLFSQRPFLINISFVLMFSNIVIGEILSRWKHRFISHKHVHSKKVQEFQMKNELSD